VPWRTEGDKSGRRGHGRSAHAGDNHRSAANAGGSAGSSWRAVTGVVAVLVTAKLLSFAREMTIAQYYGVSLSVDAYTIGINVVNLLLWVGAALALAVVPLFAAPLMHRDEPLVNSLLAAVLRLGLVVGSLATLVMMFGAPLWVWLVAPAAPPPTRADAIAMTRLLSPLGLISVLAAVAIGFHNARGRFVTARLFDAIVAGGSLLALIVLHRSSAVHVLPFSLVLGYALAVAVVLAAVARRLVDAARYPLLPLLDSLTRLVGPTVFALILFRLNSVVGKMFASGQPLGTISALGYAERLYTLPVSLIFSTVVTVFYTEAAGLSVQRDFGRLRARAYQSLLKLALPLIPASLGIAFLAPTVVRLAFQRGAFDAAATSSTARALTWFCAGLLPHMSLELLTAASRGMKDMISPVLAGLTALTANGLLCALLAKPAGVAGIAGAMSGGYFAGMGMMVLLLERRFRREVKMTADVRL